jgi:hypothetical protein
MSTDSSGDAGHFSEATVVAETWATGPGKALMIAAEAIRSPSLFSALTVF